MAAGPQSSKAKKPRGPRQKHTPQRTCIACLRKDAKRDYVRLVRTPEDSVEVDPTGKRNGRGAYLCPSRSCWERAISSNVIEQALKTEIDVDVKERLREYSRTHFPPNS